MFACAHCGYKLTLTTSGARDSKRRRMRYACHYKVRHPQLCDGQSGYGVVTLDGLVEQSVKMLLDAALENAKGEASGYERLSAGVQKRYDDVLSWANLFDECSMEAKKMIISQLINQVRVGKDYNLEIDLNVSYKMFCDMMADASALSRVGSA